MNIYASKLILIKKCFLKLAILLKNETVPFFSRMTSSGQSNRQKGLTPLSVREGNRNRKLQHLKIAY